MFDQDRKLVLKTKVRPHAWGSPLFTFQRCNPMLGSLQLVPLRSLVILGTPALLQRHKRNRSTWLLV